MPRSRSVPAPRSVWHLVINALSGALLNCAADYASVQWRSSHGAKRVRHRRRERALDQVQCAIRAHRERLIIESEVGVHLRGIQAAEQHRPCQVGDLSRVNLAIHADVDPVGHARTDVFLDTADPSRYRRNHFFRKLWADGRLGHEAEDAWSFWIFLGPA